MNRPISQIARDIRIDWVNVKYSAKPYLDALSQLNDVNDRYGFDDAKSLILYFLSNASSYRGENAKKYKAELKDILINSVVRS